MVPGLAGPLYGKGTKLIDAARAQFEAAYGPVKKKAPPKPPAPVSATGRPRRAKAKY